MAGSFLIARNPEAASALPFLLRLPTDGGLVLTDLVIAADTRERLPPASPALGVCR